MSICILVPTRGRPLRAAEMAASVITTASEGTHVEVCLIVDRDDPEFDLYEGLEILQGVTMEVLPERLGYTGSLNVMARRLWDTDDILGAFGDDVLFRTQGWDRLITDALKTPGIAYGDDLVHAAGHPTAVFMSSVIAKALGYLAIPQSRHLWVDDAWKLLGQKTGTLRYVPEAIFEHMHPAVGKAKEDQTYREVYDGELGHKDHLGFLDWQVNFADADAAKVLRAIEPDGHWHSRVTPEEAQREWDEAQEAGFIPESTEQWHSHPHTSEHAAEGWH